MSKYHDDSGVKRNGGYDDDIVVVAHLDGGDGDGVGNGDGVIVDRLMVVLVMVIVLLLVMVMILSLLLVTWAAGRRRAPAFPPSPSLKPPGLFSIWGTFSLLFHFSKLWI